MGATLTKTGNRVMIEQKSLENGLDESPINTQSGAGSGRRLLGGGVDNEIGDFLHGSNSTNDAARTVRYNKLIGHFLDCLTAALGRRVKKSRHRV
jgi:hypothetical protein